MVEWPGRCSLCRQVISSWADAGFTGERWVHKGCWRARRRDAVLRGEDLPLLASPVERRSQIEAPMMVFLLMFHFGLGFAIAGWVLMTQDQTTSGALSLVFGLLTPVLGLLGVAWSFEGRRRIEAIREDLERQGGWQGEY